MRARSAARLALSAITLAGLKPPTGWPAPFQMEPWPQPQAAKQRATTMQAAEFDLDAFIPELNPPTVEEIIASLEPIPTLEQALDDLEHPEQLPKPPVLPEERATRVEELERRIENQRTAFLRGERDSLDEAVGLAEQVLGLRREAGQPDDWYEVVDARQYVATLRYMRDLPKEARVALAEAEQAEAERSEYHERGEYERAVRLACAVLATRLRLLARDQSAIAAGLGNLAAGLYGCGDTRRANVLDREALGIRRRLFGSDHPDVLSSLNNLAQGCREIDDLGHADSLHRAALAIGQRLYRTDHDYVATSLNNLALVYSARGDLATAESLHRGALAMRQRLHPGDDGAVANSLSNLSHLLEARGDVVAAETLAREALAMRQRLHAGDHPDVAHSLNNLAHALKARGKVDAAEPLYRQALAMRQRLFSDDHAQVASSLNNLAVLLKNSGRLDEAEPLAREALAMFERLFPSVHSEVARAQSNLAGVLVERCELAEAEGLYREALAIMRQLFPGDHQEVAVILDNLSGTLRKRGDLVASESLTCEALAMFQRMFPGDHPYVATAMNNLAGVLKERGDLAGAERLYRQALSMNQRLFPGDHPYVARALDNLAGVLETRCDLAGAECLRREALAIFQRLSHADRHEVAATMNNLATILLNRGDPAGAEVLYRNALAMRRRLSQSDHEELAINLGNLGLALAERGDLAGAERYYREANAMFQRLHSDDDRRLAISTMNLADLLRARGDPVAAEPLAREALAMFRRLHEREHPDMPACLITLGKILYAREDHSGAELLFQEALALRRSLYPRDHARVVESVVLLAHLLRARGDLAAGERLYGEALAIAERLRPRIVGEERERAAFAEKLRLPAIATALAEILVRQDRPAEALGVLERGHGRALLDLIERSSRDIVAEARATTDPDMAARIDAALRAEERTRIDVRTAEALRAGRAREREGLASRKELADDEKARHLGEYDQEIAELDEKIRQLRQLESNAGARILALLRDLYPDAKPLNTQQILSQLEPGEALLAYSWGQDAVMELLAMGRERTGEEQHADVSGALLAEAREAVQALNDLTGSVRRLLTEPTSNLASLGGEGAVQQFAEKLLPPAIRQHVLSARRLIIVPDGPLHEIPLEALAFAPNGAAELTGQTGGLLLNAHPQIVYAPSATVYLNRRGKQVSSRAEPTRTSLVVLGDPIFDRRRPEPQYPEHGVAIALVRDGTNAALAGLRRGDVILLYGRQVVTDYAALKSAMETLNTEIQEGKRSAEDRIAVRYWRAGDVLETTVAPGKLGVQLDRGTPAESLQYLGMRTRGEEEKVAEVSMLDQICLHGGTLSPLPGTGKEARAIAQVVESVGGQAKLLLGNDATLTKLTAAAEGARILHIATHGLIGSAERPYDASLALTQPGTPTPDDFGFLTLDDLIRRWQGKLQECDLVVLSACDTHHGIKRGDSVMVLPWGFFYAGAPSVVASLWKVDDTATALMMIRFYENLLGPFDESRELPDQVFPPSKPMPKAAALREAKLWLRSLSAEQVQALCDIHKLPLPGALARGEAGPMGPAGQPEHPFKHPYYWSAFILIGDPS